MRAPVTSRDQGLYVHFPYCAQKCPYCDFNSHVLDHDDVLYADVVIAELEHRADGIEGPLRSVYFGGGTPSRWDPAQVGRVIRAVKDRLGLVENVEITLEANPGTVAEGRMAAYVEQGVTRFSIGVQSFLDPELAQLERIHGADQAERAVRFAVETGARVSLDLIYAQPGQTRADVDRSLDRAFDLGVDHISAYTLTVEPDTALGHRSRLGLFKPMPDDDQATLIAHVTHRLQSEGFVRYEISNYARPGFEAIHNSLYWVGAPYLGIGAGAHGFLRAPDLSRGYRYENVKPPLQYLEGRFTVRFEETQDRADLVTDRVWVGLRPAWGLDLAALAEEAAWPSLIDTFGPVLDRHVARGHLRREDRCYALTEEGFLFADGIARTVLDAGQLLDRSEEPPPKSNRWPPNPTLTSS